MKHCKVCKVKNVPYRRAFACSPCWETMSKGDKNKLINNRQSLSLRGKSVGYVVASFIALYQVMGGTNVRNQSKIC